MALFSFKELAFSPSLTIAVVSSLIFFQNFWRPSSLISRIWLISGVKWAGQFYRNPTFEHNLENIGRMIALDHSFFSETSSLYCKMAIFKHFRNRKWLKKVILSQKWGKFAYFPNYKKYFSFENGLYSIFAKINLHGP